MEKDDIVIVGAKRTAIGNFLGCLSSLSAPHLAQHSHRAALEQANLSPSEIDEVITGCVLSAGIGQAPARQAAILAGIPYHTGATTINKMCGSGMKAVMLAHDLLKARSANLILAGGMESMSNAPYLLDKARTGFRLGHKELQDHMYLDGLEDAYDRGRLMGYFAEKTAETFQFSRADQDAYAIRSLERALQAQKSGTFKEEIVPIELMLKNEKRLVMQDEGPDESKRSKIPHLRPAFQENGTITAANSSSISDGAASLILMRASDAQRKGLQPLAKIVAHACHAQEPAWFTTAPIAAIKAVLQKAGWQQDEVDLYEINEAFAVVVLAALRELDLDPSKVNVHGGACVLGHPIGASGARILVTLLYALKKYGKQKGIASLCIGGGEATAIAIERLAN